MQPRMRDRTRCQCREAQHHHRQQQRNRPAQAAGRTMEVGRSATHAEAERYAEPALRQVAPAGWVTKAGFGWFTAGAESGLGPVYNFQSYPCHPERSEGSSGALPASNTQMVPSLRSG
jgi:hypothetical protein